MAANVAIEHVNESSSFLTFQKSKSNYKYKRREQLRNTRNILINFIIKILCLLPYSTLFSTIKRQHNICKNIKSHHPKARKLYYLNKKIKNISNYLHQFIKNVIIVKGRGKFTLIMVATTLLSFQHFVAITNANACWLEQQLNGKCNQIYQQEISIEECCRKGSQFAYTEKNLTRSELYFYSIFSPGVECTPCKVNCDQLNCGPNKKCAIRNGRPKCICSIICKSSTSFKLKKSSTSREIRSLSSEIETNSFKANSRYNKNRNGANDDINSKISQRRATKFKNIGNRTNESLLLKHKRTLSTSTIITAPQFETTFKPNIRSNSSISRKVAANSHLHHQRLNISRKHHKLKDSHTLVNNQTVELEHSNGAVPNPRRSRLSQSQKKHQQQKQKPSETLQNDNKLSGLEFNAYPENKLDKNQMQLQKQHKHQQRKQQQQKQPHNPVCGNDGRTYKTECVLRKRACRQNMPSLVVAYRGLCRTSCEFVRCLNNLTCVEDQYGLPNCVTCNVSAACASDFLPMDPQTAVCGMDSRTYKSTCDIKRVTCATGRSMAVAYKGPCQVEESCNTINCGPKMQCLIDRGTHRPRCVNCRYKCDRKRNKKQRELEPGPLCGNDNRTYNSWCQMRRESCNTEVYVEVKHVGQCRKDALKKNRPKSAEC